MGNQPTKQHQVTGNKQKKYVHWKSAERPSPPGRPVLLPLADQQPDVIKLKWDRPRTDGGSPIIGYIVEHRRTGSSQWIRAIPTLIPCTEVVLTGLDPGWRYHFRTIAENVVGKSNPSELSEALTVTLQRNTVTAPRFVNELIDVRAVENEKVEIRVAVVGQPSPEINWFKDGFEIFSSRRTKIINDNDTSILIIHQVALTDEGEIKCTATNRAGHAVTRAKLRVEAPPKIRLPKNYEDGLIVEADEVLRLKVSIAGLPVPAVLWSHEGEILKNGGRFELITTDKNSSLKIDNVKRTDRGEYSVRAINKLGEDITSFLVTVTAKPTPPGKVKLKMSFGRSATLVWTAPVDDGGSKIGNYIVEYFRIGWNVWLKAATTRQLNATLHDLIEGSEYKFRVKAESPYGVSDPSEESEVLFIPDPRRGITKPEKQEIAPELKPTPPKRKNLSPLRNIFGTAKEEKRDVSPNRQHSPNINVQLMPQLYENEELRREMSYGTPDPALKRTPSRTSPQKIQSDEKHSPSPKASRLPQRDDENKLGVGQKIQQFLKRSPSPSRKSLSPPESQLQSRNDCPNISEQKSDDVEKRSPNLVRKNSGIFDLSQKVQQIFRRSPSPARFDQPSEPEADQASIDENTSSLKRSEEPARLEVDQQAQPTLRLSPTKEILPKSKEVLPRTETNNIKDDPVKNEQGKVLSNKRPSLPNPTIEISAPKISNIQIPSDIKTDDIQVSSDAERRDDVHTSSEFMLVLYPKKKSKENEKQESFDLELEEALSPPPLSLSSPELNTDLQFLQQPQLRRAVSSTELLYERAMARFYEAVELEETEKTKKPKAHEDLSLHEPVRKKLGSMSEVERLSFERRNSLRRKLSGEFLQSWSPVKLDVKEPPEVPLKGSPSPVKKHSLERESTEKFNEFEDKNEDSIDYDDDYTESTASSASEDSIEKFKIELMARTASTSGELETYHPLRLQESTFSPYRLPSPDQSSIVLSKPVPLPNPDFIPKPILKRPSTENVLKEESNNNGKQNQSGESIKVENNNNNNNNNNNSNNKSKGLISFFKKEKVPSDINLPKLGENNTKIKEVKSEENINKNGGEKDGNSKKGFFFLNRNKNKAAAETKQKTAEEVQKKKLEASLSAEEEARVVVEYYSDIVKELGSSRKNSVPIYMRGGTYGDDSEKEEDDQEMKLKTESKLDEGLLERCLAKPRLSIVERLQVAHVQDRSKLAMDKPLIVRENKETDESKEDPGNKLIGSNDNLQKRPVKKVKKKIASGIRSRDNSSSREAQRSNDAPVQRRILSRTSHRSNSKSPIPLNKETLLVKVNNHNNADMDLQLKTSEEVRPTTPEELQENVRSAVSYMTDVGLFIVACWVYIFKDARLVLPILALMVYRQIGEVLRDNIPDWLKRKKS